MLQETQHVNWDQVKLLEDDYSSENRSDTGDEVCTQFSCIHSSPPFFLSLSNAGDKIQSDMSVRLRACLDVMTDRIQWWHICVW